ncbi:hypothetical protein ASC85_11965 [Pseudomonas sp. Root401]|nr:hypothetical protein ASC85_11965 [Pseudomonas sp. Root401]
MILILILILIFRFGLNGQRKDRSLVALVSSYTAPTQHLQAQPSGSKLSWNTWECRQGRSAFRFWKVTQSVTGCIPTQSVGTIKVQSVYEEPQVNIGQGAM